MQVQKVNKNGTTRWVLLDDQMHLVSPVCEFLDFQRKIDRADNTLRAYAMDLKIYWEFLQKQCLTFDDASVSLNTIADFVEYLRQGAQQAEGLYAVSSRTNRSINRILSSVHSFYRYGQLRGICRNPIFYELVPDTEQMYQGYLIHTSAAHQTKKSIFQFKESQSQARFVTQAEFQQFVTALHRQRDRLLFFVLYYTGARIQEALDLEISMLPEPDASESVGVFRQIHSKGKQRDLYAPMFLIRALHAFVFAQGQTERRYIFVAEKSNYAGKQLTYHAAYDLLRRTQEKVGIDFNFHDLRHTFCTRLIQQGVDVGIMQQVMGHAHLYTTKHYIHLSDQRIIEQLSPYWAQQEGACLDE